MSDTIMAFSNVQNTIAVSTAWTGVKIPFNTANVTGTALSYNTTNKRIVVNRAGYVDIYAQLDVYTSGYVNGDYNLTIYKNGQEYSGLDYQHINTSKPYDKLNGQIFGVNVNVGDYFEMFVTCGGTGNVRTFAGAGTSLTVRYRRS